MLDSVIVTFLLVGHTHSIIDQRFSVIHRDLESKDAYTLQHLVDAVKQLKLREAKTGVTNNQQHFVQQALDFGWLRKSAYQFKGFMTTRIDGVKHTAHSIRLSKNGEGAVVMDYKDQDVPGPWFGHHITGEPFPVFKTTPTPPASTSVLPRRRIALGPVQEKVTALESFMAAEADIGGQVTNLNEDAEDGEESSEELIAQHTQDFRPSK